MPIYEYQGQQYDLPDGLTNDQAKAKIQAYLGGVQTTVPTSTPEAPSGVAMGLGDIVYGTGQLLAKGMQQLPEGLTIMGRPVAASARAFAERVVPQREAQYEAARQAAGETGIDVGRIAGNILQPLNYIAAPVANPVVRSAVTGGLLGATQPVARQEDYWSSKALQAGLGAVIGPVADLGVAAVGKVAEAVKGLTPAGRDAAMKRYVEDLAGPEKEAVIKALQNAKELVTGSKPTVAEALSDIPSAVDIIAAQSKLASKPSLAGQFETRSAEQQAARARTIQQIAGTEAQRAAVEAERANITGALREEALTKANLAMESAQTVEQQVMVKAKNLIKQAENFYGSLYPNPTVGASFEAAQIIKQVSEQQSSNLKQFQIQALKDNGVFPLMSKDIISQIDTAIQGAESDMSKAVLSAVKEKILSKTDKDGFISSRDLYENVRKTSNQDIAKLLGLGEQYASGGIPEQAAKALGNVKKFIDASLDKSSGGVWSDYLKNYSAYSDKLNRMEIGEFLSKKLNTALDKERAGVFATAVDNAASTIKQATGVPRYEKLSQILTQPEMSAVNNVLADLTRQRKAQELASKVGKLDSGLVDVAGAVPPWLDRTVTVLKEGLRYLQQGSQEKFNKNMTELLLDPQKMAQVLTNGVDPKRANGLMSSMFKNMDEVNRNSFIQVFTIPTVSQTAGE